MTGVKGLHETFFGSWREWPGGHGLRAAKSYAEGADLTKPKYFLGSRIAVTRKSPLTIRTREPMVIAATELEWVEQ